MRRRIEKDLHIQPSLNEADLGRAKPNLSG